MSREGAGCSAPQRRVKGWRWWPRLSKTQNGWGKRHGQFKFTGKEKSANAHSVTQNTSARSSAQSAPIGRRMRRGGTNIDTKTGEG